MHSSASSRNQLAVYQCRFHGNESTTTRDACRRGVSWVLRWAAAIAVLWFAGCMLMEFAYCLAAEHTLARAARAGALEATLPRASLQSVCQTIKRRLANHAAWAPQLALSVERNGTAVGGAIQAVGGDRMAVMAAVPVRAVVPHWLNAVSLRTSESQIEVRAERQVPGRGF
ncbi:MAG TPA: hypothetical protein VJ828_16100 [Lacipirellulaceae bacterium]|nr:hypothetical protein [Lacipirellulaceae bacterium]